MISSYPQPYFSLHNPDCCGCWALKCIPSSRDFTMGFFTKEGRFITANMEGYIHSSNNLLECETFCNGSYLLLCVTSIAFETENSKSNVQYSIRDRKNSWRYNIPYATPGSSLDFGLCTNGNFHCSSWLGWINSHPWWVLLNTAILYGSTVWKHKILHCTGQK